MIRKYQFRFLKYQFLYFIYLFFFSLAPNNVKNNVISNRNRSSTLLSFYYYNSSRHSLPEMYGWRFVFVQKQKQCEEERRNKIPLSPNFPAAGVEKLEETWAWSTFSSVSMPSARNTRSMTSTNNENSTPMATMPSLASTPPSNLKLNPLSRFHNSPYKSLS